MQQRSWPAQTTTCVRDEHERGRQEALRRVASGGTPLAVAFQTLTYHQEEQARRAVELLERETWAVTAILATSGPLWSQLAQHTLSFPAGRPSEPSPFHLEVGYFAHLAALDAPTAGERELIAATAPCWARVYPHHERTLAGQTGALASSYVPIPVTEAVAILGLENILTRIEIATRAAGRALLDQAAAQAARQARLLEAEHTLGWEPNPADEPVAGAMPARTHLALALVSQASRARIVLGAAYLGLLTALLCLLAGIPYLLLVLILAGPCILIWSRYGAS